MKPLVTGASFHDFEAAPIFIGKLMNPVIREKDGEGADQKQGDIMGYNFADYKTGEVTIIGSSHQIKRAVEQCKEGDYLRIEFKGKSENSKGQPVNIFKIDLLEDADLEALNSK